MHHPEFRRALPEHRPVRRALGPAAAAGLLTLLATTSPPAHAAKNPLPGGLYGQARVLIVFAPSDTDPLLREQRSALHPGSPASTERDLSVIEVVGDQAATAQADGQPVDGRALRASYRVPRDVFTVILIGKDGGEKLRKLRPLSEAVLFATIDRMPMRREEAARQKAQP